MLILIQKKNAVICTSDADQQISGIVLVLVMTFQDGNVNILLSFHSKMYLKVLNCGGEIGLIMMKDE